MTQQVADDLTRIKTHIDYKISQAETYEKLYDDYYKKVEQFQNASAMAKGLGDYLTALYQNVKQHELDRQMQAYALFNEAIKSVGEMVQDASLQTMQLQKDDTGKISIVDSLGCNINLIEGGAARTCVGMLLRYICLSEDMTACKMMYFDEGLFAIDMENIQQVRAKLKAMSKDCLIIITEQHSVVSEGISQKTYEFEKTGDTTTVKEIVNECNNIEGEDG